MTRRFMPMSVVTIALAIIITGLSQSGATTTVAAPDWTDGACADNEGITVVVDFQELGGGVNVRCAQSTVSNGLDALDGADIAWEGTLRFPGFVCRIAGLPTPAAEPCANTPPANAYWSYWIAPRGGDWCYANVGPTGRTPPPGSIEGWSFALDKAEANIPPPRFEVPDAVAGQQANQVNGSECTTAIASGATSTTVRSTTTTSSTSSTTSTTSPAASSTTSTTAATSNTSAPASSESVPTTPSDAALAESVGSTIAPASSSTVAGATTTVGPAGSGTAQTTSTLPSRPPPADDDGEAGVADGSVPSLLPAAEPDAAPATVELGTVDLSDDQRGGGGFGVSSLLAIVAISAVAGAGILAARRRSRPLRIET